MTPAGFVQAFAQAIASDGALILLVLLILWLGARKTWVWSWTVERLESQLTDERVKCIQEVHDIRAERDQWRTACLMQMGHPHLGQNPPNVPDLPPEGD